MSHFTTLVLFNQFPTGNIEEDVACVLAPYSESLEIDEYEDVCHCVGEIARIEAHKIAEEKIGTIDNLRDDFHKHPKGEQTDKAWSEHIKPYIDCEKQAFESHPMKDKPNPQCGFYRKDEDGHKKGERYEDESGCGGTGKYLTTYNPKSKWDWYQIGGRWQGSLDPDYDIEKDERNWEICWLCKGSGLRNDQLGLDTRKKDPTYTCNGCQGTGKMLKNDLAPHTKGNIKMVSEIKDFIPFTIVTPDGQWHEKGRMGWFACVSDGKDDWDEQAQKILEQHKNCVAVLCDLHI